MYPILISTGGDPFVKIAGFHKPEMKSIISGLHVKFAGRSWNETFQLVRRCMDKSRDESKPCEPLVRSLEKLQEVFNVSSMNAMRSRLEVIAKQQGLGFHITDATCYLTADLFYLEAVLLPCGGVEEVKVALHGEPPVSSESFLQLLRSKDFTKFSMKLEDLYNQYNIPGDKELKFKLFKSLQCLKKDLQQISHLLRTSTNSNAQLEMMMTGKEDCPLTIHFCVAPTDTETSDSETPDLDPLVQAAQVTVGLRDKTHQLQMASVIAQPPQLDAHGSPVFKALDQAPCEPLPACFLLKLQPPIPMTVPFVHKLGQITDVAIPDVDLQWAAFPQLLMTGSLSANGQRDTLDEQGTIFTAPLPGGVMHRFVFPGAAWEVPARRGAVVDEIPFTHPSHVPALLDLLCHQCAINTLLTSCGPSQCENPGLACDLHFEILPESDTSFSVTFHPPNSNSLAVLLVNVPDPRRVTCHLFGVGSADPSMNEYISVNMKRYMSVPVTLRALYSRLEEITSAPVSTSHPATAEAQNDRPAPLNPAVMDTNSASTTFSHSAAVPGDGCGVSGSACYAPPVAKSELLPKINPNPPVGPYPLPPVAVFSKWTTNSQN